MDFLKEVLGEDLYNQVSEKISAYNADEANKGKKIKLVNLSEGGYISKDKYTALEANRNKAESDLTEAQRLIESLRVYDPDQEGKVAEYQKRVVQLQEENRKLAVDLALKLSLVVAGVTDPDYIMFKIKAANPDLKLDDVGNVKGINDIIKRFAVRFPGYFVSPSLPVRKVAAVNYLPDGTSDVIITQNQFNSMGYAARLKLKKLNPIRYYQLAKRK